MRALDDGGTLEPRGAAACPLSTKTLHKRAQPQPPRTGTCVSPFDVEFPNFESTAPSHHRRNLDCFCLITPGRPARSAECSNHFDASIAGKTYVNLNDLGCERIVGAGRPRTLFFFVRSTWLSPNVIRHATHAAPLFWLEWRSDHREQT